MQRSIGSGQSVEAQGIPRRAWASYGIPRPRKFRDQGHSFVFWHSSRALCLAVLQPFCQALEMLSARQSAPVRASKRFCQAVEMPSRPQSTAKWGNCDSEAFVPHDERGKANFERGRRHFWQPSLRLMRDGPAARLQKRSQVRAARDEPFLAARLARRPLPCPWPSKQAQPVPVIEASKHSRDPRDEPFWAIRGGPTRIFQRSG